jgi:hypothetical protein
MSAAGWIVGNGEKREAGGGVYSSYGTQAGRAERVTTKTILVEEFPRGAEVKPATVRQAERLMRGANHKADGMERGEVRLGARVRWVWGEIKTFAPATVRDGEGVTGKEGKMLEEAWRRRGRGPTQVEVLE